jgi:hypothetical protein
MFGTVEPEITFPTPSSLVNKFPSLLFSSFAFSFILLPLDEQLTDCLLEIVILLFG